MRSLGVKPNQVIEQFIVEQVDVREQQVLVVGNEFLLQAAVEALDVRVHLEYPGVG